VPVGFDAGDCFLADVAAFFVADGALFQPGLDGDGVFIHVGAPLGDAGLDAQRFEFLGGKRRCQRFGAEEADSERVRKRQGVRWNRGRRCCAEQQITMPLRADVFDGDVFGDDEFLQRRLQLGVDLKDEIILPANDVAFAAHFAFCVQKRRVATVARAQPFHVVCALTVQEGHAVCAAKPQALTLVRQIGDAGRCAHLSNRSRAASIWQMNRRRGLLTIAGLIALTAAVHSPALRNGFIWDDDDHLTANPAMTGPEGLKKIWTSLAVSRYYPLTLTSFWLQRRLWGLDPLPYHAVNIALHSASAVLVFLVLRRLRVAGAWVAAAIWAVHPVTVESVAWVTELKNTQSGMFFFASVLCYLRFERERRRGWYIGSLVLFAAALTSKPSTVVLPLVLLLCTWWQRGRIGRADLVRAAPFFVLAAVMSLVAIIEQRGHIERGLQDWSLTFAERFIVAGNALWFYAWKTIWPVNLIFIYPRWELRAESLWSLVPFLAAVVLGIGLWQLRHRAWLHACLFGLGWFVIALLPVLGFFDIYFFRYSFVADHFQYLACVGIIALVAAGGAVALRTRAGQVAAAAALLAVLGVLSFRHSRIFREDETLWRDTLAKNPGAFIAYNNLGVILNGRKQYEKSEHYFREALRLKPGFLEAHSNLGLALTELGRHAEAERHLLEAVRIKPDFARAHYRLAVLYARTGRPEDAARHCALAIRYEPAMPEPYFDLGALLQQQGRRAEAIRCYETAIRVRPDYAAAHNNLGNLLAEEGRLEEAVLHYQLALKAAPDLGETHYNLGVKLAELKRTDEAIKHLREAIRLMPGFAAGYIRLAELLSERRQFAEALEVLRSGLSTNSPNPQIANAYAWLRASCPVAELRNAAQAIQIAEELVRATARTAPEPLDTLAAAYAEAGRFEDAVTIAREAHDLARRLQLDSLAEQIASRIRLYERQTAYRFASP
jgi:tetratricopeptide (TPR) repeat protein